MRDSNVETNPFFAVSKFLSGTLVRGFNPVKPECYKLLKVFCINESNELEPNLSKDCTVTLAYLAQAILPVKVIPTCLDSVASVFQATSWKAKAAALDFLQVFQTRSLL